MRRNFSIEEKMSAIGLVFQGESARKSRGQVAKSTLTGAFWGGVSGSLNFISADEDLIAKIFKHSFTEGLLEGAQGGNMAHGFLMGAVSSAGNHYIDKYGGTLGRAGKVASAAVLGGTVSEICESWGQVFDSYGN